MTQSTTTPLTVATDRRLIRSKWHSTRYVVGAVNAPIARAGTARPPVNLAFVLDRSGSMSGPKLGLAAQAAQEGIARLLPTDRFCVVMYDEDVDMVVPSTLATANARRDAIERLRRVGTGGSTDLGAGWLAGCSQIAMALMADGVNRALLLTDGLANRGITSAEDLAHHAAQLRARGVSTSTFGVGNDFDEALLQAMAQAGGGHFYDIADAAAIRDHISSEVGETLEIVAREVTLQVALPTGVRVESLGAFPVREAGGRPAVTLGDLVSGQELEVPLRLSFPLGMPGERVPAVFTLADRDDVLDGTVARVAWEHADDATNDAQPRTVEVDRVVARVFAARARQEAVRRNKSGEYEAARHVLEATARRIRSYAGSDPELRAIADGLLQEGESFRHAMPARALKEAYAQSSYEMQSRSVEGKARRSPAR